jgi:hypothetical protein
MYADDMQLYLSVSADDVPIVCSTLQHYIANISNWCGSRRLQLNASKTELIWFGSRYSFAKLTESESSLSLGNGVIKPATVIRDLGLLLDSEMPMKQLIAKVASGCFLQLRRLRQNTTTGWQGSHSATCIGIRSLTSGLL